MWIVEEEMERRATPFASLEISRLPYLYGGLSSAYAFRGELRRKQVCRVLIELDR